MTRRVLVDDAEKMMANSEDDYFPPGWRPATFVSADDVATRSGNSSLSRMSALAATLDSHSSQFALPRGGSAWFIGGRWTSALQGMTRQHRRRDCVSKTRRSQGPMTLTTALPGGRTDISSRPHLLIGRRLERLLEVSRASHWLARRSSRRSWLRSSARHSTRARVALARSDSTSARESPPADRRRRSEPNAS